MDDVATAACDRAARCALGCRVTDNDRAIGAVAALSATACISATTTTARAGRCRRIASRGIAATRAASTG